MSRLCRLFVVAVLSVGSWALPASAKYPAPAAPVAAPKAEKYPEDRKKVDAAFPKMNGKFEVLRPGTDRYNCIAWSLGVTTEWVWPGKTVRDFDKLNAQYGYRRLTALDISLQPGVQKIVLYGKIVDGRWEVTHQARQMPNGTWTSKLGKLALIRHAHPNDVNGDSYGKPIAVYVRPMK